MKYIFVLAIIVSITSCDGKKNKRNWTNEDEFGSSELSISDDSNNNHIPISEYETTNLEEIENNLKNMEIDISKINSPDKLMECKQNYELYLSHTLKSISQTSETNNTTIVQQHFTKVKQALENKIKDYSLPANGIIQNINIQIQRIENCSSKDELLDILDSHYSFFKNLSKIHLIVEEQNRQSEVQELASQLNIAFKEKIEKYDVDFK